MVPGCCSDQHVRSTFHIHLSSSLSWFSRSLHIMIHISGRLYRRNPWVDTAKGKSPNFEAYLSEPIAFFMREFTGMTLPVANFLVKNVFCILDRPTDDTQRISAREFGVWVRDLPDHMTASPQVALARRQVL